MKLLHLPWLPLLLVTLFLSGCGTGSAVPKEKTFDVKGTVVSMDPKKPSVKLDHQDIPGLMKAMVMEFDVADPKLLEGVKAGDNVQGKLKSKDGGEYTVIELKVR